MALRKPAADDRSRDEILYPADDGIPMEHKKHDVNHALLMQTLERHLEAQGKPAWLAGNNFIYYEKGNARKNVGPDFYVVLGANADPERDCWRVWNENGLLPQVIVEMLSKSTARKDRVTNFELYQKVLKVQNYFMCDHRKGLLEGYILDGERYVRLLPDTHGRLYCAALDLWLAFRHGLLRWYTRDGALLPTDKETAQAEAAGRESERQRAEAEQQRAEAERQRAETEQQRAETERQRAETERQRAEAERQRADAAAASLAAAETRLRELERALRRRKG